MTTTYAQYQFKTGTESDLLAENIIIPARVMVIATDTLRVWIGDGTSPLQNAASGSLAALSAADLKTIAEDIGDSSSDIGKAVAAAIAAGGGGGGGDGLTYDPTTGLYTVGPGAQFTYDSTSGLYTSN